MELFILLGVAIFAAFGGYAMGKSAGERRGREIADAEMRGLRQHFNFVPKKGQADDE